MTNRRKLKSEILDLIRNMPPSATIEERRTAVKSWHTEFIESTILGKPYLAKNENTYLGALIPGRLLNPNKIKPRLFLCSEREDYDLYDYLRMSSSFPTQDRPGRRMKFIVRDMGHSGAPVMGVCCLSSTVRQLKARDQWIGWIDKHSVEARAENLAYIMDISTCVSVPPYSYLTGGKLLCYMMLSNEVRALYSLRYANRLSRLRRRILTDVVLLIATGAFSGNTPQYKGVTLAGQKLFKFIGYSSGYSTFQVPSALYDRIKELLSAYGKLCVPTLEGGSNQKLRMLRIAARELGIDGEHLVFSGHRRAIYAAPVAANWREFLQGRTRRIEYHDFPLVRLVEEWKSRWLSRRMQSARVVEQLESFRPEQLKIANLLM
jgi:hypothetical protein